MHKTKPIKKTAKEWLKYHSKNGIAYRMKLNPFTRKLLTEIEYREKHLL
jgi:hypothetical protein